jgi:hypothetical protein
MAWYRGDCHVHSVHSDGELTPAELVAEARAAGLDFLATTDHNTAAAHFAWPGDFLVITGEEVTTPTGHWLALGIPPGHEVDWRYRVRDGVIGDRLAEVHGFGGLCVAAHPHAPYRSGDFMFPFDGFDAVEVWNGRWTSDLPWNADNESALAAWGHTLAADLHQGPWRPAMGNSDTHQPGQIGIPQTVVWADELSTPAILAAIRAGRGWVAESRAVELALSVTAGDRTAGIGEELPTGGASAVVRLHVSGVAAGTVTFHTDQGKAHHAPLATDLEWQTTAADSSFVRVEVRHEDGRMAALTNPVILT